MKSLLTKSLKALRTVLSRPSRRVRRGRPALLSLVMAMTFWPADAVAQCQPEWLPGWLQTPSNEYFADMEVTPNGDLIVCGSFTSPFSRVARWDGMQWTSLASGLASSAFCTTTLPDGRLAVGVTNAVMAWDGTAWTQLGGGFDGIVTAMAVRNGELVVAGQFTLAGSTSASHIARWDGTNWLPLGSGLSGGLAGVNELAALSNGDLIAVGSFTLPGRFVARWNGATWASMGGGPISSSAQSVDTVAQDPTSGALWIAGSLQFGQGGFIELWNGSSWVAANANAGTSTVRSLQFLPSGELMAVGSIYLSWQGTRGTALWNGTSWQYLTANLEPMEASIGEDAEFLADGTLVVMQLSNLARFGCPNALAMASTYGAGCDARSRAFYEDFPLAPPGMDLSNSTLRLSPAGSSYVVQQVVGAPQLYTPTSPDLGLADDENSQPIALPFALPVPGSNPVTDIWVGSNGYVNLAWETAALAYYGDNSWFRHGPTRHAAMWTDLDPASGTGGGTIHVDIDPVAQVVYATWLDVQQYGDPVAVSTFQVALFATGVVEYRYLACTHTVAPALVGWSPGLGVPDAGSIDLSAGSFTTSAFDSWPLEHSASERPAIGQSIALVTSSGPANSVLYGTVIGWGQHGQGIDLASSGMPRCRQYVTPDVVSLGLSSSGFYYHPLTIPLAVPFLGAHLYSQGIAFAPGINPMGLVTSNGVDLRLGTL